MELDLLAQLNDMHSQDVDQVIAVTGAGKYVASQVGQRARIAALLQWAGDDREQLGKIRQAIRAVNGDAARESPSPVAMDAPPAVPAPAGTALSMQDFILNGLLDELASVLQSKDRAYLVLGSCGFPAVHRPSFDRQERPLDFWQLVCEEIEKGVLQGGFEPLLAAAAALYPHNPRLKPFASLRVPEPQKLLMALATTFASKTDAKMLLAAVGYPPAITPGFDRQESVLEFWRQVCEQIANGCLEGGFVPVIRYAVKQYPHNPVFRDLAAPPPGRPVATSAAHVAMAGHDVFIAYSKCDHELVTPIAQELRNRSIEVWFSDWSLPLGQLFGAHIEDALASVKVVVVCYGTEGYGPWHRAETYAALERAVRGQCRLIPVMLPGVTEPDLPPLLGQFQGITVTEPIAAPNTQRLLDQLAEAIRDAR